VPVLQEPELVVVVQAENPDGVMMLSKSKIAVWPLVSWTDSKAVIGVLLMSAIVSVPPALKMASLPDVTVNGVAVPEHAGASPEKAMQGVLLDTDNCAVPLLLTNTPVPSIGIVVANALTALRVMTAIAIGSELVNLFISFFSSVSCLSVIRSRISVCHSL